MTTMLETAARGLWEEMRNAGEPLYDDLGVTSREVLEGIARATLRAVRIPDDNMRKAANDATWEAPSILETGFTAMIDAILNETDR